jgi:hypothetical protein
VNTYLDTSALAKLVIAEHGSDVVTALWTQTDDPIVSVLGYTEIRAAVAAAVRAGRLDAPRAAVAREAIEALWDRVVGVEIDEALVRAAGDLAERHRLQAADSIHLASAIAIREPDTAFIAFDARLRDAAAAEGFPVLPVLPVLQERT